MNKRFGWMLIGYILSLPLAGHAAQTCESETAIPSSTPSSRFTDHGNGTVTDTLTNLMWAKCSAGLSGATCATGASTALTWQAALTLADGSTLAGYTDWRLPNTNELLSIVEHRCYAPAINLSIFPNASTGAAWSAAPTPNNTSAWIVGFYSGNDYAWSRDNAYPFVRLVRAGQ